MKIKLYTLLFLLFTCAGFINAQSFIFFDDSPNSTYYETSWGFVSGGSTLELINSNKFPVDVTVKYSGLNCLRLRWKSISGGDWGLAAAGANWAARDLSDMDSIVFYAYSNTAISINDFPLIFIEDTDNNKTPKFKISDYITSFEPLSWNKVKIPLDIIKQNHGSADLTKIKTIYFGQNTANNDGVEHTLYLDELKTTKGTNVPPAVPTNVIAKGYFKHIDISWDLSTEFNIGGYRIYKLINGNYQMIGTANSSDRFYIDFIGNTDIQASYKVSTINSSLTESPLSAVVTATTSPMTDDEWLDMLQEATFRYFWDYAHPVSGLSRERYGSGNTVTSGGSGFGIMAILAGINRDFITREQGTERVLKIVNFLKNKAQRFHGVWPHWLNGETGVVVPFSQYDNGGDLVESCFMLQGLLTARRYFNQNNSDEDSIRSIITQLWEETEFDWYRRTTFSNFLYWHWSPNYAWQINMTLQGPNEAQICYLLGIASPTHSIPASLYQNGWASSSHYLNGKTFFGYKQYVGWDYGGPLFFAHYSYLGFDPRDKKDQYANYFLNNKNIALIHNAYCATNPNNYGYNSSIWGLTASDDPTGYRVHEPVNDNGTISPTAALASFPYTPDKSMAALKGFYNTYGNKIWGIYGFTDAFNVTQNWYASSYIAIDQGPIIAMVENYRSGLLWNYFMSNPEILPMLNAIGFVPDTTTSVYDDINIPSDFEILGNYPNPFNPSTTIVYTIPTTGKVNIEIYDVLGNVVNTLFNGLADAGKNEIIWNGYNSNNQKISSGVYIYRITFNNIILSKKMLMVK
ncbi:MAG: glucoamylase family protein [bacterium]